ncbi:hypothetical protein DAI22_11g192400 [Oryza sativa Japonica Group]|nr:hypothetical protein DAI22_11g192400 [Oryza sativa Japonica Group]
MVVAGGVAEVEEEGVHAGQLVLDVLDLAANAADERVLLGQEAAELSQQRPHGAVRGAYGELHLVLCLPLTAGDLDDETR